MAQGAKVWIEDKALMAFLKRATEEVPGGRKGLRNKHIKKYNLYMLKDIGKRFRKRGVNESGTAGVWPELSPGTKARKSKQGRGSTPPLIFSGRLARGIKIKVAKRGRYLVQDTAQDAKHYWFHHAGFEDTRRSKTGKIFKIKVPRRRLLIWTRPNQESLKKHLLEWWGKVQKRTTV